MIKRALQTFFKDPDCTAKLEDVVPGVNIVEGIARVEDPLRSPVRGQNCIAYFYRSYLIIPSGGRAPMPTIHKLKEAEVYAPFELDMDGGALTVIPEKPGRFSRDDHQSLGKQYGKQFQGVEEVILPGARVRLKGKARIVDGKPVLRMTSIAVVDRQAVSAGVVGDRKKRRKQKK